MGRTEGVCCMRRRRHARKSETMVSTTVVLSTTNIMMPYGGMAKAAEVPPMGGGEATGSTPVTLRGRSGARGGAGGVLGPPVAVRKGVRWRLEDQSASRCKNATWQHMIL